MYFVNTYIQTVIVSVKTHTQNNEDEKKKKKRECEKCRILSQ